jgi:hypothetical protein
MKKLCFYLKQHTLIQIQKRKYWGNARLFYFEVELLDIEIERLDENLVDTVLRNVASSLSDETSESYNLIKWEIVSHNYHIYDENIKNSVLSLLKTAVTQVSKK